MKSFSEIFKRFVALLRNVRFKSILRDTFIAFLVACTLVFFAFISMSEEERYMIYPSVICAHVQSLFVSFWFLALILNLIPGWNGWFPNKYVKRVVSIESEMTGDAQIHPCAYCDSESASNNTEAMQQQLRINCVHEAGHAVMAYMTDIKLISVHADLEHPHVATSIGPHLNSDRLEELIKIYYAGACAEELVFGNFYSGCFAAPNADFDMAESYLKGYYSMLHPVKACVDTDSLNQIALLSAQFYSETLDTLKEYQEELEEIAELLMKKKKLSLDDVATIMISHQELRDFTINASVMNAD